MGKIVEGDWFKVEVHNILPYFLLISDTCCDAAVKAALYRKDGKLICLSVDHRDSDWGAKMDFTCVEGTPDQMRTIVLDDR